MMTMIRVDQYREYTIFSALCAVIIRSIGYIRHRDNFCDAKANQSKSTRILMVRFKGSQVKVKSQFKESRVQSTRDIG